jgi:hypothetical protein
MFYSLMEEFQIGVTLQSVAVLVHILVDRQSATLSLYSLRCAACVWPSHLAVAATGHSLRSTGKPHNLLNMVRTNLPALLHLLLRAIHDTKHAQAQHQPEKQQRHNPGRGVFFEG